MKISSALVFLVVLFFCSSAFAGEKQKKLVLFAGGATLTPPAGVSIAPKKDFWFQYCDDMRAFWKWGSGPHGEIYKYEWTVQGFQCLSTPHQLVTPEKDVTPTTLSVRQDSSS